MIEFGIYDSHMIGYFQEPIKIESYEPLKAYMLWGN